MWVKSLAVQWMASAGMAQQLDDRYHPKRGSRDCMGLNLLREELLEATEGN